MITTNDNITYYEVHCCYSFVVIVFYEQHDAIYNYCISTRIMHRDDGTDQRWVHETIDIDVKQKYHSVWIHINLFILWYDDMYNIMWKNIK